MSGRPSLDSTNGLGVSKNPNGTAAGVAGAGVNNPGTVIPGGINGASGSVDDGSLLDEADSSSRVDSRSQSALGKSKSAKKKGSKGDAEGSDASGKWSAAKSQIAAKSATAGAALVPLQKQAKSFIRENRGLSITAGLVVGAGLGALLFNRSRRNPTSQSTYEGGPDAILR